MMRRARVCAPAARAAGFVGFVTPATGLPAPRAPRRTTARPRTPALGGLAVPPAAAGAAASPPPASVAAAVVDSVGLALGPAFGRANAAA